MRALRVDRDTWQWLESEATLLGTASLVVFTYLLLAFDRFGWPDYAPRQTVRLTLLGVYGWLGLALSCWAIARIVKRRPVGPLTLVRLAGHAHLPILPIAAMVLIFAVTFDIVGIWRWPALFAGLVWMPAMLTRAVSAGAEVGLREAAVIVTPPYVAWVITVGLHLWNQLAHLL